MQQDQQGGRAKAAMMMMALLAWAVYREKDSLYSVLSAAAATSDLF
jgi:hypothetical protein